MQFDKAVGNLIIGRSHPVINASLAKGLEQARDNMASRRDSLMDVLANFKL